MVIILIKLAINMILCGGILAFVSYALSDLIDNASRWIYEALTTFCVLFLGIALIGVVIEFIALVVAIWES